MIRRILSLMIFAAVISSCGNTVKNDAKAGNTGDAVNVEFASLVENPTSYMGKTISVEGKVVHVCTHSGKKLFIVGENPDVRLYIQAGENMPKFPMDLLGSNVVVEGTMTKIGGMVAAGGAAPAGTETTMKPVASLVADTCETATALSAQVALADVVMEYKSHIVK